MIHFTGFEKFTFHECIAANEDSISELLDEAKIDIDSADLLAIGNCYLNGHGIKKNTKEAFKWFKLAANYEHDIAYHTLGICYLYGIGVKQNTTEAIKWFRKAADLGDVISEFIIGYCYFAGIGIKKDYNRTVECFASVYNNNRNKNDEELNFIDHVIIMAFKTMANSGNARVLNSFLFKEFVNFTPMELQ